MFESLLIVSGLIRSDSDYWRGHMYMEELKQEFEELHNVLKNRCESEVGLLSLSENDMLTPMYLIKNNDGSIRKVQCQTAPIPLSELILDRETVENLRKEKHLIIVKYDNEK